MSIVDTVAGINMPVDICFDCFSEIFKGGPHEPMRLDFLDTARLDEFFLKMIKAHEKLLEQQDEIMEHQDELMRTIMISSSTTIPLQEIPDIGLEIP